MLSAGHAAMPGDAAMATLKRPVDLPETDTLIAVTQLAVVITPIALSIPLETSQHRRIGSMRISHNKPAFSGRAFVDLLQATTHFGGRHARRWQ
jgi:hypothetical protein